MITYKPIYTVRYMVEQLKVENKLYVTWHRTMKHCWVRVGSRNILEGDFKIEHK